MVYQSLKFFMVRIGLSFILLLTLGFFALYFIHEIALPQARFDDSAVQWTLFGLCVFFGFFAYGMVGEQRIVNALHELKDAGLQDDSDEVIDRFEALMDLTFSSYFLPGRGKYFRGQVVRRYADYLLSVGCEDPAAVRIYLKAFLQSPKGSRFRAPLLASLSVGRDLTPQETDLLLVMLEAEEYRDEVITNQLASLFLEQKKLNPRTELLFLNALESGHPESEEIVNFVFPLLLNKKRCDEYALRFYLKVLPSKPTGERRAREIIGQAYCEERWKGIDPGLHEKCEVVFFSLPGPQRQQMEWQAEEQKAFAKLKKIRIFTSEDRKQLEQLKARLGITKSGRELLAAGFESALGLGKKVVGGAVHKTLDSFIAFGRLSLSGKLISLAALFMVLLLGVSYKEWYDQRQEQALSPELSEGRERLVPANAPGIPKVYTVQVAAVTSPKQAERLVRSLKRRGIEGLYVVKSERTSGGSWYKIRFGRFDVKEQAGKLANRLINEKVIKNYFLIALPKKPIAKKLVSRG
ncbi:MAG: SPOR domain-containing protein [Nitrospinaceae bacterium]